VQGWLISDNEAKLKVGRRCKLKAEAAQPEQAPGDVVIEGLILEEAKITKCNSQRNK
jgi:hypothetical protein